MDELPTTVATPVVEPSAPEADKQAEPSEDKYEPKESEDELASLFGTLWPLDQVWEKKS